MKLPVPVQSRTPATPAPNFPGIPRGVRRFAAATVLSLVALYLVGVSAAYLWIHAGRQIGEVSFGDVALFRVRQVRHAMATRQFATAKDEFAKKNFRAAYLAFATALRREPDNVEGRLEAADFFGALGTVKLEAATLEDGLTRAPDNLLLTDKTLGLLTSRGQDRSALDLIRKLYGEKPSGDNAPMVQTYRILAMLDTGDDTGAARVLAEHPEIKKYRGATTALAIVLWKSKEKLSAIDVLSGRLASGASDYASYAQLAQWQELGGMPDDAVATARRARALFPADRRARILLIDTLANQSPSSSEILGETESYIADTKGESSGLEALADLAGRKGWVGLEKNLYLVAANREADLHMFALNGADALAVNSRFDEEKRVLDQAGSQSEDAGAPLAVQLRRREVMADSALGDNDGVRENARFLAAALLSSEPESMDTYRRLFERLGIKEAVSAFPNP
jgi:hypothetical protein